MTLILDSDMCMYICILFGSKIYILWAHKCYYVGNIFIGWL